MIKTDFKMQRKNIIVFITVDRISVYGNFKKCCDVEKLPYHSLKMKQFPIILTDIVIHKVEFK
jgi:hypothetical protein